MSLHSFHIPVMGLSFTIDTPIKVARYGIDSVISIVEDELIELMRQHYCKLYSETYEQISDSQDDARARRITAYLDLVDRIIKKQMDDMAKQEFLPSSDVFKYFEMLPNESPMRDKLHKMVEASSECEKEIYKHELRQHLWPGSIDVNIMARVDKTNYGADGTPLPSEFSDALSSLRGFANSTLSSSVIFSAGMNPRLYSYIEEFSDFYPDDAGIQKKRVILKVSDYRSAVVQGRFLAKKGIWVSEFRVESGLNCGGHSFPTQGLLLGPILEEFRSNRQALQHELYIACNRALEAKGRKVYHSQPRLRLTAQGGVGEFTEHQMLLEQYKLDSVGWGSPFLLVPEATSVDNDTLNELARAVPTDYYLSNASPLGMPFNNFRPSSSHRQRITRIRKNRPGSPCYKKYLTFNTEFSDKPICTASREYQNLKIKQLQQQDLPAADYANKIGQLEEKDCLCEGLSVSALLLNEIRIPHKLDAVVICPGPNLAFFSGTHSLATMIDHIYGRAHILNSVPRPHMFINELVLYIKYLVDSPISSLTLATEKQLQQLKDFKAALQNGIDYYQCILASIRFKTELHRAEFSAQLKNFVHKISAIGQRQAELSN